MPPKTLQEKIDLREKSIKAMRELNESCKNENGEARAMTGEEKEKFNRLAEDVRSLDAEIQAEKRGQLLEGFTSKTPAEDPSGGDTRSAEMRDFAEYLRTGESRDYNGLTVDSNGPAGALAPKEFVKELQKDLEKETHLLGRVRVIRMSRVSEIEIPVEETEMSGAGWVTETGEITPDESLSFKTRTIGANRVGKLVLVSKKAVLTNAFDLVSLIRDELGYKMRSALEDGIINGDGNGKPWGLFNTSANGISTARDVAAASATAIDADTIIKTKRAVPSVYRSNGSWLLHPDVVTDLLLLKDQNGQYIWRSGLKPGDPDILDGSPITESEFVPHTKAAGNYAGIFGDFSKYWLAVLDNIGIQVLKEHYATKGMAGYLAETFAGGAPITEKAFARIKYAAS